MERSNRLVFIKAALLHFFSDLYFDKQGIALMVRHKWERILGFSVVGKQASRYGTALDVAERMQSINSKKFLINDTKLRIYGNLILETGGSRASLGTCIKSRG